MKEIILRKSDEIDSLLRLESQREKINAQLAKTLASPWYPERELDAQVLRDLRARKDQEILALRRKVA